MKRDLIDGYLFEVTKSLSRRERKDIISKLGPEIEERIEHIKKGPIATKEEVLRVLSEYGDPIDVCNTYSKKGRKALLPQPHYNHYIKDKWLAHFVAILTIIGITLLAILFMRGYSFTIIEALDLLKDIGLSIVIIYFAYTVAFAWVSNLRLKNSWEKFAQNIKPEPKRSNQIGRVEITFQIILSSILLAIFAFAQNTLSLNYSQIVIRQGLIIGIILPVVIIYFLNVLNLAFKEIDRRYTFAVLLTTIVTGILVVGLAYVIFISMEVISSSFASWLSSMLPANNLTVALINNLGLVLFFVVVLFTVIDILSTAFSYYSDNKSSVSPVERTVKDIEEKEVVVEEKEIVVEEVEPATTTSETIAVNKEEIESSLREETPPLIVEDEISETKVINKEELNEEIKKSAESEEVLTNKIAPKSIADHIRDANPDNK